MNPEEGSPAQESIGPTTCRPRFLSTLGHELRTPLGSVMMLAEMLAESDAVEGSAALQAGKIRRAATDMQELLDQVALLARIDEGRLQPHWERPTGPAIVAALEKKLAGREPPVTLESTPDLPPLLRTDLELLTDLVARLVATEAPSRVTVARDPERRGGLTVRIRRPAPGLREEDLEFLFEPFHPSARIFRRRHGGQSLDPAVARSLAELLGGTVTAELPAEGCLELCLRLR